MAAAAETNSFSTVEILSSITSREPKGSAGRVDWDTATVLHAKNTVSVRVFFRRFAISLPP
jgi:hypothetical protein